MEGYFFTKKYFEYRLLLIYFQIILQFRMIYNEYSKWKNMNIFIAKVYQELSFSKATNSKATKK